MAEFSTTIKDKGNVSIIYLNGYLDAHTAPQLENNFSDLIENRKYKNYMYCKYKSDVDFYLNMSKKLNSVFNIQTKKRGIDHIYLYGDDINNNTFEAIKKLEKAPVEIMNPFYGVSAAELLLNDDRLRKNAYKYSSACGAALRSFKQD